MTTPAEKRRAQRLVHRAVKAGDLVRPDRCEDCGVVGVQILGHHDDYSRPLDVRWICRRCHGDVNRGEGDPRYLRERRVEALAIYREVGTYRATGKRMGISWKRAWELVKEALHMEMEAANTKGTR